MSITSSTIIKPPPAKVNRRLSPTTGRGCLVNCLQPAASSSMLHWPSPFAVITKTRPSTVYAIRRNPPHDDRHRHPVPTTRFAVRHAEPEPRHAKCAGTQRSPPEWRCCAAGRRSLPQPHHVRCEGTQRSPSEPPPGQRSRHPRGSAPQCAPACPSTERYPSRARSTPGASERSHPCTRCSSVVPPMHLRVVPQDGSDLAVRTVAHVQRVEHEVSDLVKRFLSRLRSLPSPVKAVVAHVILQMKIVSFLCSRNETIMLCSAHQALSGGDQPCPRRSRPWRSASRPNG